MQALHRTTDVQQSLTGNRATSKLEEELLLQRIGIRQAGSIATERRKRSAPLSAARSP